MIDRADYFKNRDTQFAEEWTPEIEANAQLTMTKADQLLTAFGEERSVNSGWRPAAVNTATAGAAPRSKHMTAQAIDLSDPEGDLDEWCFARPDLLEKLGLWMEHPASTKGWCHLQTVPPKSGNRVFYP